MDSPTHAHTHTANRNPLSFSPSGNGSLCAYVCSVFDNEKVNANAFWEEQKPGYEINYIEQIFAKCLSIFGFDFHLGFFSICCFWFGSFVLLWVFCSSFIRSKTRIRKGKMLLRLFANQNDRRSSLFYGLLTEKGIRSSGQCLVINGALWRGQRRFFLDQRWFSEIRDSGSSDFPPIEANSYGGASLITAPLIQVLQKHKH